MKTQILEKAKVKKKPAKAGSLDRVLKSKQYTDRTKKIKVISLWEIWRKNAYGEVTIRGYEVRTKQENWYYGPCYYDKIGDKNSCKEIALRKFEDHTKPQPWPRI